MHGKSGKVNTCSTIKPDIGEHNEACYIEGHGKSGPGKSRDNCMYQYSNLWARWPLRNMSSQNGRHDCYGWDGTP